MEKEAYARVPVKMNELAAAAGRHVGARRFHDELSHPFAVEVPVIQELQEIDELIARHHGVVTLHTDNTSSPEDPHDRTYLGARLGRIQDAPLSRSEIVADLTPERVIEGINPFLFEYRDRYVFDWDWNMRTIMSEDSSQCVVVQPWSKSKFYNSSEAAEDSVTPFNDLFIMVLEPAQNNATQADFEVNKSGEFLDTYLTLPLTEDPETHGIFFQGRLRNSAPPTDEPWRSVRMQFEYVPWNMVADTQADTAYQRAQMKQAQYFLKPQEWMERSPLESILAAGHAKSGRWG